ncbi:MAG: cytochrome b N-terminal domain-containing protein, partial [Planctomycetes bacterium]|nr:cytochrome b N-terminal domain-containing protein [Planctomycetota bacterium]
MKALLNWLDDRTGYRSFVHDALYERIPGGSRWRYVWGSTLIFTFSVQMITGLFLWMAYSPSSQTAWESVFYIQHEMQFGWLLRGIHHFTAQAMIVLLALHLMQVIIDGAYKAPREVNFWLGLILFQITLGLSLTGYLLPWDQKGYWATKVATKLSTVVPFVGPEIQRLVMGGPNYGHHTLTRFFAMHAGVLPMLLIGFLALHLYVFRRHGITVHDATRNPETTFWPDQVLKDAVACLGVLLVVLLLVFQNLSDHDPVQLAEEGRLGEVLGADLGAPADPSDSYSAARPEWYFLFLFQFLKYFPGETEIWGAIYIPGGVFMLMFLMPFIGRWKLGHRFNVAYLFILLIGAGVLTGLAVNDDRNSADYQRAVADAE